jgi:hypothetical protein
MAIHTEVDMSTVRKAGDLVPEGWYHVRVKEVKEVTDESSQEVRAQIQMVIQGPESMIGESIFDRPGINHRLGLSQLKAYYAAVGYNPGPEGHDPEKLTGTEFWVAVEHNEGKPGTKNAGQTFANVPPWSIRSLNDGQGKKRYSTQPV